MPQLRTRYGAAVVRVLNAYKQGSFELVYALESVVLTAMEQTQSDDKDKLAMESCEGLHDGPASGLICRRCFDVVEAQKMPDVPAGPIEPSAEEKDIDAHVRKLMAGGGLDEEVA